MKAIVLEQPGTFRLTTMDEPGKPGPGEALVRVRQVGVCGTDLHAYQGTQPFFTYPRILGHELSVEVVATGVSEKGDHTQGDHKGRPYNDTEEVGSSI